MRIRLLALTLLIGAAPAFAAPPKSAPPKKATPTEQTPETIDVDALARSKDGTPESETASAQETPAAPPADTDVSSETPASQEVAPETAAPADANATSNAAPAIETPSPADAPALQPPPPTPTEKSIAAGCEARASGLVENAQKANYGEATRDFDAVMRSALPPAKFKLQWESLSQFGALTARGPSHLGKGDGYTIVMIPLIFDKANLVAQIACGSDGRVAGFHVTQAPKPQF